MGTRLKTDSPIADAQLRRATVAMIPAYNEEGSVSTVASSVSRYVEEVVVIDDGSHDRTADMATIVGAKVIKHPCNQGIGSSLRTGYRYCLSNGFDFVVQLDADGQHDPSLIPKMVDYLNRNRLDVVTGSRFLERNVGGPAAIRRAGIRFFSKVVSLLASTRITDVTSGFRVYRSSALRLIWDVDDRHWAIGQTLLATRLRLRYGEIPIKMQNRKTGASQFDVKTMILYPARMSRAIFRATRVARSIRN